MKLGPTTVALYVMYIVMGVIDKTLNPALAGYGNGGTASYFFSIIIQPWTWQNQPLFAIIISLIGITTGIYVLGALFSKSDIITLAPVAGIFLSLGAIPLVALYSFIDRNIAMFGITECVAGSPCLPGMLLATLTVGVLSIMYFWTVIEFWFWRQTTSG